MSIQKKLLIIYLSFGLVLSIFTVFLLFEGRNIVEDTVKPSLQGEAELLSKTIDRSIFDRYLDAQTFALSINSANLLSLNQSKVKEKLINKLNHFIATYQVYDRILLLDTEGKIITASDLDKHGEKVTPLNIKNSITFEQQTWFKDVIAERFFKLESGSSKTVIFGPSQDIISAEKNNESSFKMIFAAPVYNNKNEIIAVLANVLDFSFIESMVLQTYKSLSHLGLIKHEINLLDENGVILIDYIPASHGMMDFKRDTSIVGKVNLIDEADKPIKLEYLDVSGVIESFHFSSNEQQVTWFARLKGVYNFPGLNWTILIRAPVIEAYDRFATLNVIAVSCLVLLIMAFYFSGLLIAKKILKPLVKITQSLDMLSKGNTDVNIPAVRSGDEIGKMINAVNAFKRSLIEQNKLRTEATLQSIELDIRDRAVNAATSGILVVDAQQEDQPIIYVNNQFIKQTGYKSAEVIGRNCRFMQGQNTDPDTVKIIREAIENGRSCNVVIKNYYKDETEFWNELRIDPVHDDKGNLTHFIGIQTDVTELKNTQAKIYKAYSELEQRVIDRTLELAVAENRMRAVFETVHDGILLTDKNGYIIDANHALEKILGYSREQLIGKPSAMLIHEKFSREQNYFVDGFKSKEGESLIGKTLDIIAITKAGKETPIELTIGETTLNNKHYFVGVMRDIAQKVKYREQRDKLHLGLELATQAAGIGIWSWDIATNELEWDDRMYALYGVDKSTETPALSLWEKAVHPEDLAESNMSIEEALNETHHWFAEFRIVRYSDKRVRWIKAEATVILDELGNPIMMHGVNLDFSKEKLAQQSLKAETQKAIAANEAKSRFLANMSHEIRTPMNGVVGMIDLLNSTPLSPEQQKLSKTIKSSAFSLLDIINDILDISKIEAGELAIEQHPTSFVNIAEMCCESIWYEASQESIDLYLDIAPTIPSLVMSDPIRVRQILLNLLSNAIKFSKNLNRRGQVSLNLRLQQAETAQTQIIIEVCDNGIGIPNHLLANLFKPFVQLESSTTRKFGGTGLGLTITKSLVEKLNGRIETSSKVDKGSTFTVILPCFTISESSVYHEYVEISGLNILLIMEDAHQADIITNLLSYFGNKINIAASTEDAELILIDECSQNNYDIVIFGDDILADDLKMIVSKYLMINSTVQTPHIILTKNSIAANNLTSPKIAIVEAQPLKNGELLLSISKVIGANKYAISNNNERKNDQQEPKRIALSLDEAEQQGTLILVAEDHSVNRDVIIRQLSFLGYTYIIVNDGRQAFNEWQKRNFGLILTDCHMPDIDGFALTAMIRAEEKLNIHLKRVPIIAITADALVGNASHCISSGMDDYLAKPIEINKLQQVVNKWLLHSEQDHNRLFNTEKKIMTNDITTDSSSQQAKESLIIDFNYFSEIIGSSDRALQQKLLKTYWQSALEDYASIENAIECKNEHELRNKAHAAKGAAKSSGAVALGEILSRLETDSEQKEWNSLNSHLLCYKEAMDDLERLLIKEKIV